MSGIADKAMSCLASVDAAYGCVLADHEVILICLAALAFAWVLVETVRDDGGRR